MNIIVDIREVAQRDINHLLDIDIKCFDYCWTAEDWRMVASSQHVKILIASWYGTPLGFVVTEPCKGENDETPYLSMPKLAVKPSFRGRGIGTKLLSKVWSRAFELNLPRITTVVSETMCDPTQIPNSATWLTKMQFKSTGIVRQFVRMYGQHEDGYKFELEVKHANPSEPKTD